MTNQKTKTEQVPSQPLGKTPLVEKVSLLFKSGKKKKQLQQIDKGDESQLI